MIWAGAAEVSGELLLNSKRSCISRLLTYAESWGLVRDKQARSVQAAAPLTKLLRQCQQLCVPATGSRLATAGCGRSGNRTL